MKFDVTPGKGGFVVIRHGLGSEAVTVRCENADGEPVGYLAAVPLDGDRIEVVTVPSTRVAVVHVNRVDHDR